MTSRLLCAFHPSGASFAVLSHDQRLKIFSTLTQQLTQDCSEVQQLNQTITAIAFPAHSASSKPNAATNLIALGTKGGDILLWHVTKGAIEHTLGGAHKHTSAVQSLAFAPNGSALFSCGADRSVKQWSVSSGAFVTSFEASEEASTGSGGSLRHLAVSPDGTMLLAGGTGSLLLWHLSHPASPMRDYQGPTDRIACLAFSPDSKYVVSGAADRYLSLWSAETSSGSSDANEANGSSKSAKKKSKASKNADKNTPLHTFTLQTAPISVQFNAFAVKGVYQLAALSDSSIVSVLQWVPPSGSSSSSAAVVPSGPSSTPISVISVPHASVQSEAGKRRDDSHKNAVAKSSSKNRATPATAASSTLLAGEEGDAMGAGVVQALHFHSARALTLARGDAVRPLFQQVVYAKEDGGVASFEAEITLPRYQHQHLMSSAAAAASSSTAGAASSAVEASKKRKANNEPVTLGAQHMGDMVQAAQSGLDGDADKTPKRAKLASTKSKSDALSRSLADRLAESESAAAASSAAGSSAFNLSTGALPKAGSLQTILQQALHSNDASLVEYCLTAGATAASSGHANLVRVTVRRLAPVYVMPLLQHLMSKFSTRPNRAAGLLPWLREIFRAHTAFLIRQPALSARLAPLSHLLEQRSAVFKKMLKLQARLDLLLGQIAHNHSAASGEDDASEQEGAAAGGQTGALNTFNDGEEDDDEEEQDEDQDDEDEDEDAEDDEDEEGEEDEEDEDMGGAGAEDDEDEE